MTALATILGMSQFMSLGGQKRFWPKTVRYLPLS